MIEGIKEIVRNDRKMVDELNCVAERLKDNISREKNLKKEVKNAALKINAIIKRLKKNTGRFKI